MPAYEYVCESCGNRFEKSQNMSDMPITECPECGKPVRRVIGAGLSVITKGKNFYSSGERKNNLSSGRACCGKAQRCDKPPCAGDGVCKR